MTTALRTGELFDDLAELKLPAVDRVTLAQFNPLSGDIDGNTSRIIGKIEDAKARGSEVIAFTEAAVTGYCVADMYLYDDFIADNKEKLSEIAAATKGIIAIVGFIDSDPDAANRDGSMRKYNAAAVFCDGELIAVRHKQCLANYRYFDDKRYFVEGEPNSAVEVTLNGKAYRFGVVICEDGWDQHYDVSPIEEAAKDGAREIFVLNASPYAEGKMDKRLELMREHAVRTGLPIFYVNTAGVGDNGKNIIPFDGRSFVLNGNGELIHQGKAFQECDDLITVQGARSIPLQRMKREKELFEAIVMSVKEYVEKSGFKKVIIPVSGGIDSAVALGICVAALGSENVITHTLPSKFNSDATKGAAWQLMRNFKTEEGAIPIQEISDLIQRTYEAHRAKVEKGLTIENLHPKIRSVLEMIESSESGALLISCGNKTEIALGYCTLYGDMCGALSPIGDLDKIDVYRLGRYINELFGKEMIPEAVFKLKPSAELAEGQVDPFDYWVTVPMVKEMTELYRSPRALVKAFEDRTLDPEIWLTDADGRSVYDKHTPESFEAEARRTFRLIRINPFKRVQGAPIIAVSRSAFGFDRRETLLNGWQG